jgi:hypothetical protein
VKVESDYTQEALIRVHNDFGYSVPIHSATVFDLTHVHVICTYCLVSSVLTCYELIYCPRKDCTLAIRVRNSLALTDTLRAARSAEIEGGIAGVSQLNE